MWTADCELGVVFNGEIYNHGELRAELEARGHAFRTHHSDTEVLLHGFREWGAELLPRLDGMFAFALLERGRRRLWLARDRFGEKPLFWWRGAGAFAFASELTALREVPGFEAALDPESLRKYFAYGYVPAPRSIYRGAHKLPAGCLLSLELPDGEPRVARWWEFRLEPEPVSGPADEGRRAEELRGLLERAVARRLLADVPVGVFLSGGIDSSGVAALAARHSKPGELRTFCVGFDEASFDESAFAEQVAGWLGAEHHGARFDAAGAARSWPELAARLDEPLADPSLLPAFVLCGLARRHVTVALGGDGADELFAGYDPFRALRFADLYARRVPRPLHRALRLLAARLPASHGYMSAGFRVSRALKGLSYPPPLWNPVWLAPLEPGEIAELLGEPVEPEAVFCEAIEAWEAGAGLSLVDRTLQFFTRLYLQDDILVKLDRASMLHGLEVRSPYLDAALVDFARRLPADCKLRGGTTKWILRRALSAWLPGQVLARRKQGFGVPVGRWLAEGRAPFDAVGEEPFAREKLRLHRLGRGDERLYLYAQWMLTRFREAAG
jgi:asparagine synthase (glutamine-hydrolysing)